MPGILDKIKSMFGKQPDAAGAPGGGSTSTLKDKAGDVKDKAGDVAEKVVEKIPEPVKEAYGKVADKVEEAYEKVSDKVEDLLHRGDDATPDEGASDAPPASAPDTATDTGAGTTDEPTVP